MRVSVGADVFVLDDIAALIAALERAIARDLQQRNKLALWPR